MAKKKREKKRSQAQWVRKRPDEVFARGPIRIERYGRFVRMYNVATPEEHADTLAHAEVLNREILADLATGVNALQSIIARHDPLELMQRAAYILLPLFMQGKSESELTSDEAFALPLTEYIQYLIARTPQGHDVAAPTEEIWTELWQQASHVMELTQSHLMLRKTLTQPPTAIDDLRFMIDGQRLGVRVERYAVFHSDHLRSALTPYRHQLQDVYGLTAEQIIDGLAAIGAYQMTGVSDRYSALRHSSTALMERLEAAGYQVTPEASPEELERIQAALETPEFRSEHEQAHEAARLALTPALFDITDLTTLPRQFLSLLSIRPGESVLTTLTGPGHDDLSPLSQSVLHHKPFIEIADRFYFFLHSGFEDRVADIIEADLFAKRPEQVNKMTLERGKRLESDAQELLAAIMEPDMMQTNLYYPNPDDPGNLTELDLLIAVDDILLLVEAKAGSMDAAASRGAPDSLAQALSDLIVEGQRQSERAEKYVRSSDEVSFFDETGKRETCRVKHSRFRRIYRIIVTREALGWVGAKIAILSVLDPTLSKSYPWHVAIDDLRVISHLFGGDELRFLHYLELRLLAAGQTALSQADELEHVGLYNKMNYYHQLPVRDATRMSYAADYMLDIDHYFMSRSAGIALPLPTQSIPMAIRALLSALRVSGFPGRFEVASLLLSLSEEARDGVARTIKHLDDASASGRQRSFRTCSEGIALSLSYAEGANWDEELRRSAVQMEVSGCSRSLVVQLVPGPKYEIRSIEAIAPGRFSTQQLAGARLTHERRTRDQITEESPGRNDPCPCGSTKKFKKCHGFGRLLK